MSDSIGLYLSLFGIAIIFWGFGLSGLWWEKTRAAAHQQHARELAGRYQGPGTGRAFMRRWYEYEASRWWLINHVRGPSLSALIVGTLIAIGSILHALGILQWPY